MIENTMLAYGALINVNEGLGRYRDALDNFRLYKDYSDSIFTSANQQSINEMEIKYQTEKKQKEIELLNRQKEIQSFKNKLLIAGIVIMLILTGLILFAFINKRKHNKLLTIKNAEIYKQREEISQQAETLAEANHEITQQKNLIEKSHIKITDSINYAKYIQTAVMPSEESISGILRNYFIMFEPCDIVSGDFYFIKKVDNRIFIAAADCTGHGVPGAFMSMLGIALLNELVRKPEIKSAAALLEMMRKDIKASLQQTGQHGEQREGIDIALCILNSETGELNFAGAYNPLWLFHNNELTEIIADRQPVGIHPKEKPFTDHSVQLNEGDTFYIFSDGYYSQFGGGNCEKMKTKRFKEIITGVNQLPLSKQKIELESKYYNWKGNEFQIDDILVIGVQYSC
jgi:serine phosphatase RsbU (regulator of sigma subunit)